METKHKLFNVNANNTKEYIPDKTVSLVITSPPYPMIEMWDNCFSVQDEEIGEALHKEEYKIAFEKMHHILDDVWEEVDRVLIDNGIVCINIGDATKNCGGVFQLFSNHSRVIKKFIQMGYSVLPDIIWHKQTNAPNKFMGSGMYPPGAYVTYEHEYILIFRKGSKREFNSDSKLIRRESAYFWEERNEWFSDVWDIKGVSQRINNKSNRERSAAFPLELAYRLVNMFSIKGDIVYDPFCGIGTVMKAAICSERNSINVDIDETIINNVFYDLKGSFITLNKRIEERIIAHESFINKMSNTKKNFYFNNHHKFSVVTKQEVDIVIRKIKDINMVEKDIICNYEN